VANYGRLVAYCKPVFYHLGVSVILVLFWSVILLTAHASHIVSVCYFHLRQLRLIRQSLTADTAHVIVRALIHSRLDYCNGLLSGLPTGQIARLQGVLRSAARLVLSLPSRAPVSAAMHDTLGEFSTTNHV